MFPLFLLDIAPPEQADEIAAFYEKYRDDFLRYAKSLLWRKNSKNADTDAEDMVQNAFYKILKSGLLDFSKDESAVKAYVILTIESVTKDFINKRRIFVSLDDSLEYSTHATDELFERLRIKENYSIVVSELEKMDSIYNYTLLLRMREWKPAEIAEYMNVPVETVYTRIKRGEKLLIERLKARKDYG